MRACVSPLGALARGLLAGASGSYGQNLFLKATSRIAPSPLAKPPFKPPESKQRRESSTTTLARRFVEQLMQRGPLGEEAKSRGGSIVHYTFGAAWGGALCLACDSVPALDNFLVGSVGFGTFVWVASEGVLLPAFRLSAPIGAYSMQNHAYALLAHVAFGSATWLTYRALRSLPWMGAAGLWLLRRRGRGLLRTPTRVLRRAHAVALVPTDNSLRRARVALAQIRA